MNWFWIAFAAPAMWAAVNHIDKYFVSKYFTGSGIGSLVVFTSISGFIVSVCILIFKSHSLFIGINNEILIGVAGAVLVASFIPYLHALETEEPSMITALYQLIPVFSYFLALIFLNEHLTQKQILASLLVIAGAMIISFDLSGKLRLKSKPFFLMVLSAFMIAVNALIFKIVGLDSNFWGTAFWEYIGGAVFGVLLFLIPLYRQQFIATYRKNSSAVMGLSVSSELLNIGAKMAVNFASLLAPLALVWVVNGFQPLLVFGYGIILTLFIPRWGRESLGGKVLIQRILSILIIFVGVYFLFK